MYEKSYGSKYHATQGAGYMSAADIAKLMRADIKAAKAKGELAQDVEVSVTVKNFSGGRSINAVIGYQEKFWTVCDGTYDELRFDDEGHDDIYRRSCGGSWYKGHEPNHDDTGEVHEVLSVEGQRVKKLVQRIHWAYNYDGSDSMVDYFDVNYYGHAEVESKWSHDHRIERKAEQALARKNAKAKGELIDHLLAEHRGQLRYGAKKGNLQQWYAFEKLVALHEGLHAKQEANA
jgi:hypothetical protein